LKRIVSLLGWQTDIEADAGAAGFEGTAIGRLHDTWTSTGNDCEAGLGQPSP
jgi:hypothetical protein